MANTTIQLKYSVASGNTPVALANGEIAINGADGKLYYRTPSGTIQSIVTYPGPAGLNKEVQFNDAGTAGANAQFTFDKSTGTLTTKILSITVANGTSPISVTSNTLVTNLNADLLDGQHLTYFGTAANTQAAFDKANSAGTAANTDYTFINTTPGTYGSANVIPVVTLTANGRVSSITNTNIQTASTTQAGVVQLNDTYTSTSTTQAATANSVKNAYQAAVDAATAMAIALG